MQHYIAALALAGSASAAVLPRQDAGCCFQLVASGGQSGTVGQLDDGQNRIGGGHPDGQYCIGDNGGVTDGRGRGCILTPPTTQFQCDEGASPTTGFSVGNGGSLSYNGNDQFHACAAAEGEYNFYTTPVEGQENCVQVTLKSGGQCSGSGNGGSAASSGVASASSAASSIAPASAGLSSAASQVSSGIFSVPSEFSSGVNSAASSAAPSASAGVSPVASEVTSGVASVASGISSGVNSVASEISSAATSVIASSTPAESAPGYSQPSAQTSQPAAETTSAFVCNPAHSYPNGASCISSAGSLTLVTLSSSKPVDQTSAPSAPADTGVPAPGAPADTGAPAQSAPAGTGASTPGAGASFAPAPYPTTLASAGNSVAPSGTQPASGSASASGSACQTSLSGAYQTPHLIVPVSSEQPDQASGTSYNGQINSTTSTIFQFDIPQDYEGKQCSLIFLFPKKSELETADYTFGGSGSISFSQLSSGIDEQTSYSSAPSVESGLGSIEIQPGNSYVVANQQCNAGSTQTVELSSENGLSLNFFEDWNPSPLGLFLTSC